MITKKQFIEWLENKWGWWPVGIRKDPGLCPLARANKQITGKLYLFSDDIRSENRWDMIIRVGKKNPPWARKFQGLIDHGKFRHTTAKTCLKIMEEI